HLSSCGPDQGKQKPVTARLSPLCETRSRKFRSLTATKDEGTLVTRIKQILAVILLSACIALVGCGGGGGGGSKKKSSQHQNQTPNGSQNNQGSQDDANDNAAGDHSSDDDSQQHNHGTPDPGDD